jgi:predicted PurR-regulated permease PerM
MSGAPATRYRLGPMDAETGKPSSGPPHATALAARSWREMARRPATAIWLLALLGVLGALWAGRSFCVVVASATTLAVLLWPLLRQIESVVRLRALAAALVLAIACAVAVSLGALVTAQLTTAGEHLPDALRLAARDVGRLESLGATTMLRTRFALAELDRNVARVTGTPRSPPQAVPGEHSGSLVASVVERSTTWLAALIRSGVELVLQAGVIVILCFFLLCTGDRLAHRLSRWVDGRPLAQGSFSPLVSALAREVRAYSVMTLLANALIGLAVGLGFAAFGVAAPWKWGLLVAALHFVPYAGMALTMALAAIEVYVQHEAWGMALLAASFVAIVGLVIGSALATWLQGRASRIDSALMFAGTVFFAVLWGAWGLVLGPLLVVMANVVFGQVHAPVSGRSVVRPAATASAA